MLDTLLQILIAVGAFSLLLPLIVFVHEYGHFKMARICGVRVDTFSIGFGPALLRWTDRKGTEWKISAIPLGGFVKFFGDANAASAGTKSADDAEGEDGENGPMTTQFGSEKERLEALLTEEEKRVCFHFKPVWARAAIVAAGPVSNLILAAVIFAVIFGLSGVQRVEPVVGHVVAGTAADAAGFEEGDRILSVNGRRIVDFDDLRMKVQLSSGTPQVFEVERDGRSVELTATPRRTEIDDAFGNKINQGRLGIEAFTEPVIGAIRSDSLAAEAGLQLGDRVVSVASQAIFSYADIFRAIETRPDEIVPVVVMRNGRKVALNVRTQAVTFIDTNTCVETTEGRFAIAPLETPRTDVGPIEAVGLGIGQVGRVIDGTVTYIGRLVSLQEDLSQFGGPIKIAKYAGQAASIGFDERIEAGFGQRALISLTAFMQIAALMSVSIGLLNLLPVPVLDGGHLMYYAYEAVAGQPLSERVQAFGFRIGIALVGALMVFVFINDPIQLLKASAAAPCSAVQ